MIRTTDRLSILNTQTASQLRAGAPSNDSTASKTSEAYNSNRNYVSLSVEAKSLTSLNQSSSLTSDRSKIYGEGGLMLTLQGQVSQFGAEADMLKIMPNSDDPARLDLANQAVDYALGKGENPFGDIDRLTLSRIGLDESGAFTPAERSAAILEMANRDNDYAKNIYTAQQSSELGKNESGSRLIQVNALLEKAKGMTEEEQIMMGISVGALKTEQGILSERNDSKDIKFDYENLKTETDSVLSAISINGSSKWANVSISNLASEKLLNASSLSSSSTDFNARENSWIQIYTKISDLT